MTPAETSVNPPLTKAGEFDARQWLEMEFPVLTPTDAAVTIAARAYAAGRAASMEQSYEQGRTVTEERDDAHRALAHTCIEYEKIIADLRARLVAGPATAQLSEEFLRDVLEITDGHLGKIIRRVAKGEGNKDGLWEHVNRQANALLRSQPAGTEE